VILHKAFLSAEVFITLTITSNAIRTFIPKAQLPAKDSHNPSSSPKLSSRSANLATAILLFILSLGGLYLIAETRMWLILKIAIGLLSLLWMLTALFGLRSHFRQQ
jgi:hypothetical protein